MHIHVSVQINGDVFKSLYARKNPTLDVTNEYTVREAWGIIDPSIIRVTPIF